MIVNFSSVVVFMSFQIWKYLVGFWIICPHDKLAVLLFVFVLSSAYLFELAKL